MIWVMFGVIAIDVWAMGTTIAWAHAETYDLQGRAAFIVFWPFFAVRGLVRSLIYAVKNT